MAVESEIVVDLRKGSDSWLLLGFMVTLVTTRAQT